MSARVSEASVDSVVRGSAWRRPWRGLQGGEEGKSEYATRVCVLDFFRRSCPPFTVSLNAEVC